MIINLVNGTKSSKPNMKRIQELCYELVDSYHISDEMKHKALMYFLTGDGKDEFCAWLKTEKGITATTWQYADDNAVYGYGFKIEEDPGYTKHFFFKNTQTLETS